MIPRTLILTLALLMCAPVTRAAEPATATEAAKAYSGQFKERKGAKAIETFWDLDGMFVGMFGDNMKSMTPAQTTEMHAMALKIFTTILANDQISEMMAQAKFEDFKERDLGEGRTAVDFTVSSQGSNIPNTLVFHKTKDAWKIIDAGNTGRMFVAQFKGLYEGGVKAGKLKLPIDMFRMVEKSLADRPIKDAK